MSTKADLLAEIARSRTAIARDTQLVRQKLDVALKIQNAVRRRPFAWLAGSAAIGYIFAGPKTRTKTITKVVRGKSKDPVPESKKKRRGLTGLIIALFKFALPLLRPALSAYAAKRFGDFAQRLAK
jgi:hypothetical protein